MTPAALETAVWPAVHEQVDGLPLLSGVAGLLDADRTPAAFAGHPAPVVKRSATSKIFGTTWAQMGKASASGRRLSIVRSWSIASTMDRGIQKYFTAPVAQIARRTRLGSTSCSVSDKPLK